MVSSPSPPTPPDPAATAAAQTQSNRETAIANANLNRYNQFGPQGSVTWNVTGTNSDGTPRYEQTTSYSPTEQNIYDLGAQSRQNIAQIATDQSARIGNLLNTPFDVNQAAEQRLFDLGRARLDPMFEQRQAQTEQQLANQGITRGSVAYDRAMQNFNQDRNDAYNQLALTGNQQAFQQSAYARAQPFNETSALMSGSQVSQPWMGPGQTTNQANTDVAGIYQNDFSNRMGIYNAEMNQQNAMFGGLAGLGGAAMRFIPWSDRRLKENIKRIGTADNGLPIYSYRYVWGGPVHIGVMADDVEKVMPEAVHTMPNGFKAVDYERAV